MKAKKPKVEATRLLKLTCSCGRILRGSASVVAKGRIVCTACKGPFLLEGQGGDSEERAFARWRWACVSKTAKPRRSTDLLIVRVEVEETPEDPGAIMARMGGRLERFTHVHGQVRVYRHLARQEKERARVKLGLSRVTSAQYHGYEGGV